MLPPIRELQARLKTAGSHLALLEQVLAQAAMPAAASVYTTLFPAQALATARAADAAQQAGHTLGPLAGLPVSLKDLYDIAGRTTMAGSVLRTGAPAALRDAQAVARLKRAGAAVTGLTNMTEFAFSGVGLNPHHGTPRNPCDAVVARIPGGSSAGAAVSVALGQAVAGLGSDTGGSIRIPAALCGLVGFKYTQARTPLAGLRLALPGTLVLDALQPSVAQAFERTLQRLSQAGALIVPLPLAELAEVAQINAPGGFSAVEAYALHREALRAQRERFDPRVAQRVALGAGVSAADYITMQQRRREWMTRVEHKLQGFDALICPTVPITAPPMAALVASDEAFFQANGLLLRNTFPINFLDGCAFTLPCHGPGELPVGLMLAAPAGHDAALAGVALAVEALLAAP